MLILTYISIPLDSGANLFRTRGDCELGLALQTFIQSLLGQRGRSAHVLVARVRAAADQTCKRQEVRCFVRGELRTRKPKLACIQLQWQIGSTHLSLITHLAYEMR